MDRNCIKLNTSKKKRLTPEERRRNARRRAARRRKVYFFRTLFAAMLVFIVVATVRFTSLMIFGKNDVQSLTTNTFDGNEYTIDNNFPENADASIYERIIYLDPGHGFDDEGARSDLVPGAIERDIVFDLARRIKKILNENDIGVIFSHYNKNQFSTVYTEAKHVLSLNDRVKHANSLDIDLFLSIHCDFYEHDSSVSGPRIYYMEDKTDLLSELSQVFSKSIKYSMNSKKPLLMPTVPGETYYVLRYTDAPSVLIETGFLSNKKETQDMLTDKWRDNMAKGIANGIISIYDKGLLN